MGYITALLAVLLGGTALAYQDEGHLFTSAVVVYSALDPADAGAGVSDPILRPEVARLAAFCTQLPDQSLEYDAVQVVNHAIHLGTRASRQWLQWVQEDIHALTGGDRDAMRACAGDVVRLAHSFVRASGGNDPHDVCALGFAIHLLGDSFAHFQFDAAGKLYSSPLGHFRDYHQPDLPFYEPETRVRNWLDYISALRGALDLPSCGAGPPSEECRALAGAADAGANAFQGASMVRGGWSFLHGGSITTQETTRQLAVRQALVDALAAHGRGPAQGFPTAVPDAPGGFGSQNLPLDSYVAKANALPGGFHVPALNGGEVWRRYARIAGDVLTTDACQAAFSNSGDWQTSRPDAGYSNE